MNDRFNIRYFNKKSKRFAYLKIGAVNFNLFTDCTVYEQGQFCTDLKDKNGKLIYEGDIVEYKSNGDKCEIIFDRYQYMAKVYMLDDIVPITELLNDFGKCPFEVIGNIYENKELLDERN